MFKHYIYKLNICMYGRNHIFSLEGGGVDKGQKLNFMIYIYI
jgi:hypothetical protein